MITDSIRSQADDIAQLELRRRALLDYAAECDNECPPRRDEARHAREAAKRLGADR